MTFESESGTRIRAAVTRAINSPQSLETLQLAAPGNFAVLVRVVATGVCHTDIAMRDQLFPVPHPIVLGHEGAGVVERVGGSVSRLEPGDHVVMTYNSCGTCESCIENQATYCHDFFGRNFSGLLSDGSSPISRNGEKIYGNFFGQSSFADYALCHERNVVKVPKDVPLEILGPLACGIQTGAGAVMNALKVGAGRSIAIFGSGSVGLSAVMAAHVVGAGKILAIDLNDERLDLARELGATHIINAAREDPVDAIKRIAADGVHFSLDTTGVPRVIRQAVESLTFRGEAGLIGAAKVGTEVSLDVLHIMTAGRKVRGIVEGDSIPELFIPRLIELHRQGLFPFDRLIKFYPFEEINQAFHDTEIGLAIKPVIRMNGA